MSRRPCRLAAVRLAVGLVCLVLAGCGTGNATPLASSPPGFTPGPLASAPASVVATPLSSPSPTDIPGYEGWSILNPAAVQISVDGTTLVMHLTGQALWFRESRGVLFWTPTDGDFRISATVHTMRFSDPTKPPGGDGSVQLAGIMARKDTSTENYVFIVVGSDADGLSVETKSTNDSVSDYAGPAWPTGDAQLKLCRIGTTFTLAKRAVTAGGAAPGAWTVAATFERPDLGGELQVGPNIYTNGVPDLVARFDAMTIESIGPGEPC